VNFFLQFKQAVVQKDTAEISHQLGKVLKNCVGCSAADTAAVNKIATAAGVAAQ